MTKQLSINNTTSIAGVSVTVFPSCNSYNSKSKQPISALISHNSTPVIKTTSAGNTTAIVSIRPATSTSIANAVAEVSSASSINLLKASSMADTFISTSKSATVSISTSATAPVSSKDVLSITKRKYSLNNEQLTATITHIFTPKMVNIAGRSCSSSSSNDTNGRSAALERAYVHDVYENCEESSTGLLKPKVVQFLSNLEPGSIICDVGCGSGRYLNQCNSFVCSIGVDRCFRLSHTARQNGGEVALCDNLELPFRNECFDAVLSLAVIHHFATTERRVNALRELARILRIGGKVIITVWALEQKHRRFESQDVLIPWQQSKSTYFNNSDDDDYDDFLPPYHAYTEDSNSSRSAGDGDSSSLSSSSPGESCYSFVRKAIKKLAGSSKHTWFLDSWILKDTPKNSSLDVQDAKDLPIELRGLENLDYIKDPKLSTNLKSRSLSSILYPPSSFCEVVRSISSVPSLDTSALQFDKSNNIQDIQSALNLRTFLNNPVITIANSNNTVHTATCTTNSISSVCSRRPKLVKQKQSLYDEDFKLPDTPFMMYNNSNNNDDVINNNHKNSEVIITTRHPIVSDGKITNTQIRLFMKQSSLNEELMAGNRIQEKERVRKRIQKQRSLNEAFLCKSTILSKKLHVIREGFTKKVKNSTDTLERATKNSLTKLMQNLKSSTEDNIPIEEVEKTEPQKINITKCTHVHHHHSTVPLHQHQQTHLQQPQSKSFQQHFTFVSNFQNQLQHFLHLQNSNNGSIINKFSGPVTICKSLDCASTACYCAVYHHSCTQCSAEHCEEKTRRHSRESGSDSSKDNSLQSDTSIESEESFASVIYTPKPAQSQQQEIFQQQHQSSSSSNSSSSNGATGHVHENCVRGQYDTSTALEQCCKIDLKCSVPTSPFLTSCPQTSSLSPAIAQMTAASLPKTMAGKTTVMDKLSPANSKINIENEIVSPNTNLKANCLNFNAENIREKEKSQVQSVDLKHIGFKEVAKEISDKNTKFLPIPSKITRQTIRDLPPIPKFRKQLGTHFDRQSFPIVRRSSLTTGAAIPAIPKLLSLELFNPETDDLDSDSSEASSPDSIDSVISAPKSNSVSTYTSEKDENFDEKCTEAADDNSNEKYCENFNSLTTDSNFDVQVRTTMDKSHSQNEPSQNSLTTPNGMQINKSSKATDKFTKAHQVASENTQQFCCNAKDILLFNAIKRKMSAMNKNEIDNIKDYIDDPYFNYRERYAQKDLAAIRNELRERRLMLANLSTKNSDNQSPVSSSTSSLSSQTRSFTIHEEEEDEDEDKTETSCALKLYNNLKMAEFDSIGNNYKCFHNTHSEIMCLLQDDDVSSRDEDDIEHDVILEEDEDIENESLLKYNNNSVQNSENSTNDQNKFINQDLVSEQQTAKVNLVDCKENSASSTASLDSPSEHGGNATHHRFYHVFREGELDALINHHVNNLHIISSYYERANWCIVAEKVHVWTI